MMRIPLKALLLGLLSPLLMAADSTPDWQPYHLQSADTWIISEDVAEQTGTLYLYCHYALDGSGVGTKRIWFGIDFPELKLGSCYVSTHEPVMNGANGNWHHYDDTPHSVVKLDSGPSMLLDGWTRSWFNAPYVVLRRGNEYALLGDGPSEAEMFSKLRALPVSTNVFNLHVLNYDAPTKMLLLSGTYYPNGALYKDLVDATDAGSGATTPAVVLDHNQRQFVLIGYDTATASVTFDYLISTFEPLYVHDGRIYGIDVDREPADTLITCSVGAPDKDINSQLLELRAGESIECVYPWKSGELLVCSLRSVYRLVEATGELTYLFDLVLPAQQTIAGSQETEETPQPIPDALEK